MFSTAKKIPVLLFICLTAISCGGGGGGGGSSSGGGDNTAEGSLGSSTERTTKTGVRIIHAAIDLPPVTLSVGGRALQTVRFAQVANFVRASEGAQTLIFTRANESTTTVTTVSQTLDPATEYSVLLYGTAGNNNLHTAVIADPVSRPEIGHSFFRFIHAYDGSGGLTVTIAGQTVGPISEGSATALIDIPSGEQTAVVKTTSGSQVASLTFTAADRGEGALVLAGSKSLAVRFKPLYQDLD